MKPIWFLLILVWSSGFGPLLHSQSLPGCPVNPWIGEPKVLLPGKTVVYSLLDSGDVILELVPLNLNVSHGLLGIRMGQDSLEQVNLPGPSEAITPRILRWNGRECYLSNLSVGGDSVAIALFLPSEGFINWVCDGKPHLLLPQTVACAQPRSKWIRISLCCPMERTVFAGYVNGKPNIYTINAKQNGKYETIQNCLHLIFRENIESVTFKNLNLQNEQDPYLILQKL